MKGCGAVVNLISAEEAKELTLEVIANGYSEEIEKIAELINTAIRDGERMAVAFGILQTGTRKQLDKMGYKIKVINRGFDLNISVIEW